MIDLHCHIDLYDEPQQVLDRAEKAGVFVLSVTTTPKAWHGTFKIAEGFNRVRTALGFHPQLIHERFEEILLFEELLPYAKYIGEIGLDKSRHFKQYFDQQEEVFKRIIKLLAQCGGKIMSIHSNGAASDVISILEENPNSGPPIFHWFSGSINELNRAIKIGAWFSVGPRMILSKKGKELLSRMPKSQVLLETDGPFTKSISGKVYEPIDTIELMKNIANLWGLSLNHTRDLLWENFKNLTSYNVK